MPVSDHKNFAISTLASPPSGTGGTSLTVGSGHGALFPTVPFNVTVWPAGVQPTSSNAEIMRVTNKATDVFTVTRAQEGTSARTFSANDQIAATITARVLEDAESATPGVIWVSDPEYGASLSNTPAQNVTAIRAAMAACVSTGKNLGIDALYTVNNNFTFDGDWSGKTVFGLGPGTGFKIGTSLDEDANVEAGWTIILDGASNGALTDFRLTNLEVDGNRGSLAGFDPANTTVGVVGYQDSDFHNVQVDNVWAHDYLQGSGLFTFAGGIKFIDCHAYSNDYHGLAVSRSTTFGDADKWAEVVNLTAHDNSGYGLDAGRYCRTIVENLNAYWNTEGGFKFSIGTEALIMRGARLAYNLGPGFQDTDTVGTAILDIDGIVTHNNGGIGFRLVSGSYVRIGSITSYDNYCRTGASRSGNSYTGGSLAGCDILLGTSTSVMPTFSAEYIRTKGSPTAGVLVDGNVRSYRIGYLEAIECETAGFSDAVGGLWATSTAYIVGDIRHNNNVSYLCTSAHTSGAGTEPGVGGSWATVWQVTNLSGSVESGLMVANNNAGTAASGAAAALICERPGAIKVRNVAFRDDQATPTQHSGMYFTSAVQADVDLCNFGTGISAGSEVYSATTGTRVRFGHNNTGTLVTRARGAATEAGGGGTVTVTYPTAISNLGGLVFFSMVYPTSSDASEANYISAVSRTALTLTCPGTFGGGAGTVTFNYDVQAEIQR